MLCEQVLGKLHDFDTTGKTIEYVDIEWHEAFKKIHKKTTDKTHASIKIIPKKLPIFFIREKKQKSCIFRKNINLFCDFFMKMTANAHSQPQKKPERQKMPPRLPCRSINEINTRRPHQ